MGLFLGLNLAARFQGDPRTLETSIDAAPLVDTGCYELPNILILGPGSGTLESSRRKP
ncbi:MAG: hypothetical protein ACI89E_002279 [Planctomycetota bacterium]|jgi:hypothetical protein